jgi:EpsI family protein
MLLIAAGTDQTGFLQVHRPEYCYSAAGYRLGQSERRPIAIGDGRRLVANKLLATRNGQSEWLLYWTRVGTQIPGSWAEQRLAIAVDNLKQIIPDAMLIRVSTIMLDGREAEAILGEFIQTMIGSIAPPLRRAFVT